MTSDKDITKIKRVTFFSGDNVLGSKM